MMSNRRAANAAPFVLRQAQEIDDRDAGHPKDRVDPVQLERLHDEVKAVGHVPWHVLCAHIVYHFQEGAGSNEGNLSINNGDPLRFLRSN